MLLGFDVRSDHSLNPCIVIADLGYDDIRRNSGATCQSCGFKVNFIFSPPLSWTMGLLSRAVEVD